MKRIGNGDHMVYVNCDVSYQDVSGVMVKETDSFKSSISGSKESWPRRH